MPGRWFPDLPEDAAARAAYSGEAAVERLTDPAELDLLRRLALYPRMIEAAALAHEPHRIAFYLYDLASEFHALWTGGAICPIYASLSIMMQRSQRRAWLWFRASSRFWHRA
jgi:arginyl-tRNA synthetase